MNLVVNSTSDYEIETIEGEILSSSGRVKVFDIEIPPYPKLLHLTDMTSKMIVQKKVNGYNVRVSYIPQISNFIAVLRGGYICAKTTFMLRTHFAEPILNFFDAHPKKILCMEVLGKKSLANLHIDYYKELFGFEDIGYFVFDIMDQGQFLPFTEVEALCSTYKLQLIPIIGIFDSMNELNKALQQIPPIFEGAVVKSLDGTELRKYRFDQNPTVFLDKIPQKPKRQIPPENIIIAHFFQGYEETELGLHSGITPEELSHYRQMIDELKTIVAHDPSQVGTCSKKVVDFLLKTLQAHGTFKQDQIKTLEKLLKQRVGSEISKLFKKSTPKDQ